MSDTQEPQGPWVDLIVAEVRAAREALLANADYDLHTLCERLRARQAAARRQVVRREPRPTPPVAGEVA